MANQTINIPRPHLIMGLCLPLAVLIGYLLAEPMDSGSLAVIFLVLGVLLVPVMMKWHHSLLLITWNAAIVPVFLPGRPTIWVVMAFGSLLFAVLNRSVNPTRRFSNVPSITKPLLFLSVVVVATAVISGGIGLRSLGSERYGGKGYFYILAAVMGYFALTSQRIPPHRASWYTGIFFLSAITALVGNLVFSAGPAFYFLYNVFPVEGAAEQVAESTINPGITRITGLNGASTALYAFLLCRYGVQGALDLRKPLRPLLFLLATLGCVYCGFRSVLLLFVLTFFCTFWFEGLFRTRMLGRLIGIFVLAAVLILPQAQRLPLVVQRSLSVLPIVKVDPVVKSSVDSSTQWRIEMWKQVIPQVPRYLLKGKGYTLDPNELFLTAQSTLRGFENASAAASLAGDYHNGLLSVVIPFGIWGLIGFGWFVTVTLRYLYYNHRFGNPALQRINTFLLAFFLAKVVAFIFIFGSLFSDLFFFTGIAGLSVSLNGAPQPFRPQEVESREKVLNYFPEPV
jgi:hypothetical protein